MRAWVVESCATMPITLNAILPEMTRDPLGFLRHYYILISGNHDYSGVVDAWLIDREETQAGFTTGLSGRRGKTKQRPWIDFAIGYGQPGLYNGGGTMPVWYVKMRQMNEQWIDTHTVLPSQGGPDIMMTSVLSGCTFGIGIPSAGAQIVSHIQPPNKLGGTLAHPQAQLDPLVRGGLFDGELALFSRRTQPAYTGWATIIGVRRRGSWAFYAQTLTDSVWDGAITGAFRIG
jgi:hypothetical protein